MADPFIGEIRLFSFNKIPRGWTPCHGQLLQISQNTALYSLLGTTYGGDGRSTFALPDLRGRVPLQIGTYGNLSFPLGLSSGESTHTLTIEEMPRHTHPVFAQTEPGTQASAVNTVWAASSTNPIYAPIYSAEDQNLTTMNSASIESAGQSQPHNNMQPYVAISFCIALQGIYPSRP